MRGNCVIAQSGGPTAVINSSACGVIQEALKHSEIEGVFAAHNGILGVVNEDFFDLRKESPKTIEGLRTTPAAALGSCRYKLKTEEDYKKVLDVFVKYNIRYFFYNGGNDSMDTCNKISKFFKKSGYDCNIMGVPKTIDNDLNATDHSPGYASAAKYVATTLMELYHDATVYDAPQVTIVEIMGRNAGWLTAAAALAQSKGQGPDLIYLPEVPFDFDDFFVHVQRVLAEKGKCIVAVSEGVKTADGKYIPELFNDLRKDAFGHVQLGGTAQVLAEEVGKRTKVKVRAIEFSLLQRSSAHLASKVDVEEAYLSGKKAVKAAIRGTTDKMVGFKRVSNNPYKIKYVLLPLKLAANTEQTVPLEWILPDGKGMTQEYLDYAFPLIQGESKAKLVDGLPHFARLKKIRVEKK